MVNLHFHLQTQTELTTNDAGYTGNLKDNQWHDIMITFEANKTHGLKYYVDGSLILILQFMHQSAINQHLTQDLELLVMEVN